MESGTRKHRLAKLSEFLLIGLSLTITVILLVDVQTCMAYTLNPSSWLAETGRFLRTPRAIQRNPISGGKKMITHESKVSLE